MDGILQIVGNEHTVQLFGIRLVGVSAENAKKLAFSVLLIFIVWVIHRIVSALTKNLFPPGRARFWTEQVRRLFIAVIVITGLISIWFNNPAQLGSAAAFVTAGLAIASQRMITALAGYFIILRGKNFDVGDRIVMGGVRGDVIAVGFMQTTIMEMGQPPPVQADEPSMWVAGRQYTGRIVTITNDKIFDEPVYNYTRDFPYLWEEMRIPISFQSDRRRAEQIIVDAAREHTIKTSELGEEALKELERRYMIKRQEMEPRVYYRLTDNWVEMSVRFVTREHGIRGVKDAMSRQILDGLDEAKIGIASGTYQVVGMPELRVRVTNGSTPVPSPSDTPV